MFPLAATVISSARCQRTYARTRRRNPAPALAGREAVLFDGTRFRRALAVHPLRAVPADLPDLRRDETRKAQPARAHPAHAECRRGAARSHGGVRRRDVFQPRLPRVRNGVPGGRGLHADV